MKDQIQPNSDRLDFPELRQLINTPTKNYAKWNSEGIPFEVVRTWPCLEQIKGKFFQITAIDIISNRYNITLNCNIYNRMFLLHHAMHYWIIIDQLIPANMLIILILLLRISRDVDWKYDTVSIAYMEYSSVCLLFPEGTTSSFLLIFLVLHIVW